MQILVEFLRTSPLLKFLHNRREFEKTVRILLKRNTWRVYLYKNVSSNCSGKGFLDFAKMNREICVVSLSATMADRRVGLKPFSNYFLLQLSKLNKGMPI